MNVKTIHAADLFCGAGGLTTGLVRTCKKLGVKLDILALNHWEIAVATHKANHPDLRHICEKIDSVNPREAVPGGRLDMLMAAPECFPAGTLVLTENSYEPIETITPGTKVFTHLNRWRQVTQITSSTNDTIILKGQGHPGLEVTLNHPIYVRTHKHYHRKPKDAVYHGRLLDPQWVDASKLTKKFMWATPVSIPSLHIPPVPGRGFIFSSDFWWFVGLWLAEGSVRIRPRNNEITISCGKHEADELGNFFSAFKPKGKIAGKSELRWRRRNIRTATLFETAHKGLVEWLVKNFGRHATGKRIPSWVYGMPREQRVSLLNGYLWGDGCIERYKSNVKQGCQTVSKQLAYGIKTLTATLGNRPSVHIGTPCSDVIEGRKVNIHPAWKVIWTISPKYKYGYNDGEHHWTNLKRLLPSRKSVRVFNLSVEEDESYVAEGVVVHNCTHFSIARGGKPCSDQSRATAWHVLRWCDALEVDNVLIENVREFKTWGPLGVSGMPLKSRRGETYRAFLSALRSLNYRVEEQMLNAADFGGATTRERLFILARRGNKTIHWPKRTHAPPEKTNCLDRRLKPWRTAREIIDWSLIGKSIFARKKPLSPNTLRRIAAGIKKFCGIDLNPFFVMMYGTGKARSVDLPLPTVTAKQHIALCKPFLVPYFGERKGQPPRVHNVGEPLPTVTSHGAGALVEPFLIPQQSGGSPRHVSHPVPTIATAGAIALCEPWILPNEGYYRGNKPRSVDKPLPTITAGRGGGRVVMPFIVEINHNGSKNGNSAIRAHSIDDPLPTVEPYIVEYYGHGKAKSVRKPLPTVTTHDRFALVEPTPVTNGNQRLYLDIRLRMLAPHELAAAMGFSPSYKFAGTKTEIVKQIGNAVQVDLAEKLTYAILSHHLKTTRSLKQGR